MTAKQLAAIDHLRAALSRSTGASDPVILAALAARVILSMLEARWSPLGSPSGSKPSAVWRVCKAYSGDCDHCPPRETLRGEDTVRACYLQAMECLKAALDEPEIPSGKEGV